MIVTVLRLVANVIFPAIAGYVVTLYLAVPLAMTWFPALYPSELAVIASTGLVTSSLCLAVLSTRRLIARRAR